MSADGCFALIFWRRTRGGEDAENEGDHVGSETLSSPSSPPDLLLPSCVSAGSFRSVRCLYPANILRSGQQTLQKPRAETQLVGNRSGGEDGEDKEGKTPVVYNSTKNKREYNINI